MWKALEDLSRFIATPRVPKYRVFAWLDTRSCPDHQLIAIARDDDTATGILHSRLHKLWSLRLCTWQGKGNAPRYTPSTTFETFPFPPGLTPDVPANEYMANPRAIAVALEAQHLVELGDRWLNPSEWVEWVDEPAPGYPKRPVPRDEDAAKALKKRTLTNLYNARSQWLADAHEALDAAVAAASAGRRTSPTTRSSASCWRSTAPGGEQAVVRRGPWTARIVPWVPAHEAASGAV